MFMLLVIYLLFVVVGQAQYLGDDCVLVRSKQNGKCSLIKDCPSVLPELRRSVHPQLCGFDDVEPIVCCPYTSKNMQIKTATSKSEEKCKEYTTKAPKDKGPFAYVIGGDAAQPREFPHMALLGYGDADSIQWKCGGTLISEDFVLTAAHCMFSKDVGPVKHIRLGILNIQKDVSQPYVQNFTVSAVYKHPNFKPPTLYNDIALLRLSSSATFTTNVKPACLNNNFDLPTGMYPTATGWGQLGYTGDPSNVLMKVSLTYYNTDICQKSYTTIAKRFLPKGIDGLVQLCAGGKQDEEKDTCPGDSGGPLQLKQNVSDKLFYVVGVTSFGRACGVKNTPGVYCRVSNYVTWIERIVWPDA